MGNILEKYRKNKELEMFTSPSFKDPLVDVELRDTNSKNKSKTFIYKNPLEADSGKYQGYFYKLREKLKGINKNRLKDDSGNPLSADSKREKD